MIAVLAAAVTCFVAGPAPVALAATFSAELAQQYGQVLGRDARARDQDAIFAPMLSLVRVPQAERNFETLGEDPFLMARLVNVDRPGSPFPLLADARQARRIAEDGAVLLRNKGGTLPLSQADLRSLAVIGTTARQPLVGGGGSRVIGVTDREISPLEALR